MTSLQMVKEFHKIFVKDISMEATKKLRIGLIEEELTELREALDKDDRVEILDALVDLQYVLDGAFIAFGLDSVKDKAFEEVHRSNMSKLGLDGKPIYREDWKIVKGPNYQPPNLLQFINQTAQERKNKMNADKVVINQTTQERKDKERRNLTQIIDEVFPCKAKEQQKP